MGCDNWLSRPPSVLLLTLVCAMLWGSAFPMLKIGFGLLQINESTGGKLYFAAYRFLLAGGMIFVGLRLGGWRLGLPTRRDYALLLLIGLLQTTLQYGFLYVGLANTTSIKASIITGSGSFYMALFSHWLIADDPLTIKKSVGLVVGFFGLVVLNLKKQAFTLDFALTGEGFIFFGVLLSAVATTVVKKTSARLHPPLMVAYQLTLGGAFLLAGAVFSEPMSVIDFSVPSLMILVYLSGVSAAAFSLWYLLLKYNRLSQMAVYRFLIPVCGTFLSAAILPSESVGWKAFLALVLVCCGMVLTTDGARLPRRVHQAA